MRRIMYFLKRLILWSIIGYGLWYGYRYFFISQTDLQASRAYMKQVVEIQPSQIRKLILSGKRNNRVTLLYVFDASCLLCRWHFGDVLHFADQYNRQELNVLLIGVGEKKEELAAFVYKEAQQRKRSIPLKIAWVPLNKLQNLYGDIFQMGGNYEKGNHPYLAIINKSGKIDTVPSGFDKRTKINGLIERALSGKM